jgi:hypothetical protein
VYFLSIWVIEIIGWYARLAIYCRTAADFWVRILLPRFVWYRKTWHVGATDFWMRILLVWFIRWYRKRGMLAPLIFWMHQRQEHAPVLGEHGVLLCEEWGGKRPLLAVTFSCATIDCFMWVVAALWVVTFVQICSSVAFDLLVCWGCPLFTSSCEIWFAKSHFQLCFLRVLFHCLSWMVWVQVVLVAIAWALWCKFAWSCTPQKAGGKYGCVWIGLCENLWRIRSLSLLGLCGLARYLLSINQRCVADKVNRICFLLQIGNVRSSFDWIS